MSYWKRRLVVAVVVLLVLGAGAYARHRYIYPYGWSHCCDKYLSLQLDFYADEHAGWYPYGEATPEASLSLLYRWSPESATPNLLRGKIIPENVVRAKLESGELLTPETCGWHYVEGLRRGDDSRLALFWDKIGLGHNGERLTNGGHPVGFVNGTTTIIPAAEWDTFLAEQQQLHAQLMGRVPPDRKLLFAPPNGPEVIPLPHELISPPRKAS